MSDPLIMRRDDGPVAILTLNRPDRRNALSRAMMAELDDAIERVSHDAKIRSVVLTGDGTVFCSGMDLKEAEAELRLPDGEHNAVVTLQEYGDLIQKLHALGKPTVAALNGDALAGGAGLMSACDFAIAGEGARIGYPEVLRGMVPAVVMVDLVRLIGDRRARQLLLAGELISATTAFSWGLLNEVTAPDGCLPRAIEMSKNLVQCAPQAMAVIKRLLDETESRPANLRGPAAVSAAIRVSDEAQEGIRSFLEKRPPQWAV